MSLLTAGGYRLAERRRSDRGEWEERRGEGLELDASPGRFADFGACQEEGAEDGMASPDEPNVQTGQAS